MAKIAIRNNKLVVDNITKSNYDEIFDMLSFQWGFNEIDDGLEYDEISDASVLHKVVKYIESVNELVELDNQCKELLDKYVDADTKLLNLSKQATESKKVENTKIDQQTISKLEKYQVEPILHASGLEFSANFSVPGSGKTWMTYFAYEEMKKKGDVERILIIAPLSAFKPWEFEYQEIFGKRPNSYRIKSRSINEIIRQAENKEIFLVSYATAALKSAEIGDMLEEKDFLVVCDESHYIKNPNAKRTQGVLSLGSFANRRVILTGTPLPQGPNDLWSQFTFLFQDNEILGSYDYYKYQIKNDQFPIIKKTLEPFYTRVTLEELNLPKPIMQRKKVKMAFHQEQIYNAIAGTLISGPEISWEDEAKLDEWRTNITVYLLAAALDPSLLKKIQKSKRVEIKDFKKMSFPDMIQNYVKANEAPGKIPVAIDQIKKIVDAKKKVVVWCTRVKTVDRMYDELKDVGYESITVTGRVPQDGEIDPRDNREKRIEEFKTSETNILIANPASCAESISLHKHCQNAIYLDRNFNGAQYMQSLSRIHRVRMPPKVNPRYMMLMADDTIDEDVDSRLDFKHQTMLKFLNDDFSVLDLDLDDESVFGTDADERKKDFEQVVRHLTQRKK